MVSKKVAKKFDTLEKKFNDFQASISNQTTQALENLRTSSEPMRKEHNLDEHVEGESNHQINFHGGHKYSSH